MPPALKTIEHEPLSYEGQIDEDARSAYAEVMGRIKSAKDTEGDVADSDGGDSAASRPTDKTSKEPKEESRDDGRDEKGRFAAKAAEDKAAKESADAEASAAKPAGEPKPDVAAAAAAKPVTEGAPPSFSLASKAEWAKLPEAVRADIVKREQEMGQGLKALQEYKDIKPYAEMARQHNTTVPKALEHFIGMERILRSNLPQGLAQIAENFGYDRAKAAALFADMAAKLGAGQPTTQPDPLRDALSPILSPLEQQLKAIQSEFASQKQAQQQQRTQTLEQAITEFAADPANSHYAAVEEDMALLFETGKVPHTGNHAADMKAAYDLALRMNPQLQEALIEQRLAAAKETERKKEQEVVDKAKQSSRSLTGSKMPGTTTKERAEAAGSYDDDLEADVRKAFRQHTRA